MKNKQKILNNYLKPRQWFALNQSEDNPEILIYDQIGSGFWDDGMTPGAFVAAMNGCGGKKIKLRINSPGGNIHDGFTIYNAIKQYPGEVDVYIDGLAASAAAFIAMAGKQILIPPTAEIMIHDPWGMVVGSAEDLRAEAAHLDSLREMIANIYSERTGNKKDQVLELMKNETWMDGNRAVALGFADCLLEESRAAACLFELDEEILPGLPEPFRRYQNALKKRAQEQALRDAGLSRAEAARCASTSEQNKKQEEIKSKANELIKQELNKWLKM